MFGMEKQAFEGADRVHKSKGKPALSDKQVMDILTLKGNGTLSTADVLKRYQISRSTITNILKGTTYKHVYEQYKQKLNK